MSALIFIFVNLALVLGAIVYFAYLLGDKKSLKA